MTAPVVAGRVSLQDLQAYLHYAPEDGVFTWKISPSDRVRAGSQAGGVKKTKAGKVRWSIGIKGVQYTASRLAWLYMTGEWPENLVDHIDGDPLNQRWVNLRDINTKGNAENQRKAPGHNKVSGLLGVGWSKARQQWRANISTDGKRVHLGYFDLASDAHEAYLRAKRMLHTACTI